MSLEMEDQGATIYSTKPWRPNSPTLVAIEGEEAAAKAIKEGMDYLLEVSVARDVIKVWSAWREGRQPSANERCEAVIHYAINDAYLPA